MLIIDLLLPKFVDHARKIGYEKHWIVNILAIQLFAVLFEGIGIGTILPMLQYMNSGGDAARLAASSRAWKWLLENAAVVGLPINLVTLMCGAFVAILFRQTFMYLREVYSGAVEFDLQRRLRDVGFDHFIYGSLSYHDQMRAGDFVNELTTELQYATGAMTSAANFLGSLLLFLGYLTLAGMLSAKLTIVAAVVFLVAAVILLRVMRNMREVGMQVTRANQDLSTFLIERLKSVRLVRVSGVEEAEKATLMAHTRDQRDKAVDRRKILAQQSVLIEPIILAMTFVLLYLSVTFLKMEIESIMLFFFILLRLVPIMKSTMLYRQGYVSNLASVDVIERRLTTLAMSRDPVGGQRALEGLARHISFRNVSFEYHERSRGPDFRVPALVHLSLEIPAHHMTALVGPSGAGKSTLVDLLPRLREPSAGEILFDGIPQKEFTMASLRRAISFAPQNPHMFNVTVAEHIRYGMPGASIDEVKTAARLAQAADFIEALPGGYNTLVGENGGRLSGGQKQRVDLARAIVRRAPVLVLDEPTANLDADSEALFREALEQLRRETDMTIIIIGHRLSTVMGADQIVVLEAGEIREIGTHSELLRSGGWYARAFDRQHGLPEIVAT